MKGFSYTYTADYLVRERIEYLLTPDERINLFTIVADSGYGKTKAVIGYLAGQDLYTVWTPLTFNDNYSSHFWENFINSVRTVNSSLAQCMEATGFPADAKALHHFMRSFTNEIYRDKPYALVFDDLQIIGNERIMEFLQNIVYMNAENLYIYLISRTEIRFLEELPFIPRRQITAAELTFTYEEVVRYFQQKGLFLPEETLEIIYKKSEGWPCALYLVSLTVEHQKENWKGRRDFTDRILFDTIDREIFSQYPRQEQDFLLHLSLLDFYPIKLMEELFGTELDLYRDTFEKNVFIRYNNHTRSFQVHQLFRDFLDSRSGRLSNAKKQEIYQKAGAWYEKHQLIVDALSAYRRAEDYRSTWKIIQSLLPGFFTIEFTKMLLETLAAYPESFRRDHPMVEIVEETLLVPAGELEAEPQLSLQTIATLEKREPSKIVREALGNAYANLGFYYMIIGEAKFSSCFKKAVSYLPEGSTLFKGPHAYLLNGDPVTLRRGGAGELDKWLEELQESEPYRLQLLHGGMGGMAKLARAASFFYRGDMKHADVYIYRALYEGKEYRQIDIACQAYFLIMQIAMYRGDYENAVGALQDMQQYVNSMDVLPQFNVPDVAEGWFYASLGFNLYIPDWIIHERAYSMQSYTHTMGQERLVKAWSMLNDENYEAMIPYLHQSIQNYEILNKSIFLIQSHMLCAVAYYRLGEMDAAVGEVYAAYDMSWKNHIIMPLANYGQHIIPMLEEISGRETGAGVISAEWIQAVLAKAAVVSKRRITIRERIQAEKSMDNRNALLSEGECEILHLLSEGKTREEISDKLDISPNGVNNMFKSVYAKLGAINGSHAVRIAALKGII